MFARSGWHRVSPLGENLKLIDMMLEQPILGDRAAVQVKSRATQRELDEFVEKADATRDFSHLFFVCHSPVGRLDGGAQRPDLHIWSGRTLAEMVFRVGLVDWTVDKVA